MFSGCGDGGGIPVDSAQHSNPSSFKLQLAGKMKKTKMHVFLLEASVLAP